MVNLWKWNKFVIIIIIIINIIIIIIIIIVRCKSCWYFERYIE